MKKPKPYAVTHHHCLKKRQFRDEEEVKNWLRKNGKNQELDFYKCRNCSGYHLYDKRKAKRKRRNATRKDNEGAG